MLTRTEGYAKHSQGQRIGAERYNAPTRPRQLFQKQLKRYAELPRNEVVELEDKKPLG